MFELDAGAHSVQPAFSCEPDMLSPGGAVACWLLDPPGVLAQFVKPVRGTMELASWLVEPAFAVVDARFPKHNDLTFVLDLAHMVGRSAAARSILLHSAKVLGSRFARVFLVAPVDYPPMYLKAMEASIAIVRLLGLDVTVAGSSRALLERYGFAADSARSVTSPLQPALQSP